MKTFNFTLILVLIVDLLATAGDVALSWTSPIYPKFYSNDSSINPLGRPITTDEDSWLGSLVTIGAMVGPLPFCLIAAKFGRKISILCIAVPYIISYIIMAFSTTIYLFYFGRVFAGLAMGGGYAVLPMYVAEISEASNRGMMSMTLNIFWALGNFTPFAVGPFTSVMWFNIILACIPVVFIVIFYIVGLETPYYLVGVNKIDEAEKSLIKLRSHLNSDVQKELESIRMHLKEDEGGHFSDIFKKKELRFAFMICMVLIVAQAMSGIIAITFYLQPIFEASGTSLSPEISSLSFGFAYLISSFFAPFLVDRMGRRILTISSCFGIFLALLLLGAFFYIKDSTTLDAESVFWIPIFSLIFFIFSLNFGLGAMPFTLCAELFPNNVKQIAASAVSSTLWIFSFLLTRFFNDMKDGMGVAGTFWFFSACSLAAAIFSILFVPETKGKTFSEIQDMLMLKYGSAAEETNQKPTWDDKNRDINNMGIIEVKM